MKGANSRKLVPDSDSEGVLASKCSTFPAELAKMALSPVSSNIGTFSNITNRNGAARSGIAISRSFGLRLTVYDSRKESPGKSSKQLHKPFTVEHPAICDARQHPGSQNSGQTPKFVRRQAAL
eukprot:CAMPEP_0115331358 /NCGR_PEP_ID=MMETSP0270-20121206/86275_1 /TAXON_ID=71861 /ORGANISM="Scrippsiella trochoidea, Strain CCMP3099" /LENGTH=122 /DNA_ID=CAMNT_0002752149 /DNA_START=204 /DNA_END=571 /DNA_ORIENTATION=-